MNNTFDPNVAGKTSPYLLRRRRSLQEAEADADARHRYRDLETEARGETDRLDNRAITEQ